MALLDVAVTVANVGSRATVVAVRGELDLSGADRFRAALAARPGRGGYRRLIVDLVGTTFIDSSGLGAIAAAAKRARDGGDDLVVVANDPRILRVFQLTGLDRSVAVVPSLDAAMTRAHPPAAA